jgi:hypothetical protein
VDGKRASTIPRRKTVTCDSHGKEALATTENDLIVEIPMVVGIRPVVVQPRTVLVALAVEDVRVTVRIGLRVPCHLGHCPPRNENGLHRICDHKSSSTEHQVFPF